MVPLLHKKPKLSMNTTKIYANGRNTQICIMHSKTNLSMQLNQSTYMPIMIAMLALPIYRSMNSFNFFLTCIDASHPQISNSSDCIKLPWHATTLFEMLIDQIEECVEFADTGNLPFTAAQILNMAYNIVFKPVVSLKIVKNGMHSLTMKNLGTISKLSSYKLKMNCSYKTNCPKFWLHICKCYTSTNTTECCPVLPTCS